MHREFLRLSCARNHGTCKIVRLAIWQHAPMECKPLISQAQRHRIAHSRRIRAFVKANLTTKNETLRIIRIGQLKICLKCDEFSSRGLKLYDERLQIFVLRKQIGHAELTAIDCAQRQRCVWFKNKSTHIFPCRQTVNRWNKAKHARSQHLTNLTFANNRRHKAHANRISRCEHTLTHMAHHTRRLQRIGLRCIFQ